MDNSIDMQEIRRLAQSPAGQKLLAMLQNSGGTRLEAAMTKASQGDYREARDTLSAMLASPEAQRLLRELEGGR